MHCGNVSILYKLREYVVSHSSSGFGPCVPVCTRRGRETETSRDYLTPEVLECRSRSQLFWPSHLSEFRYLYIIPVGTSSEKYNVNDEIHWEVVFEILIMNTYIEDCCYLKIMN